MHEQSQAFVVLLLIVYRQVGLIFPLIWEKELIVPLLFPLGFFVIFLNKRANKKILHDG